tara:strand:- start:1153 stop:1923 length:771 start_codon:yes stop_codon:yes gene_type:complete
MNAATTSLAPANSTRGEWRNFAAFLKRPALPPRARPLRMASLVAVLRLLLLDLAVMGALLGIAGTVIAFGVDMPETALAGMDIGPGIVFAVVIVAPLAEEIAFRGWLSGRPGHLLALVALVGGGISTTLLLSAAGFSYGTDALETGFAAMALGALGGVLLALAVLYLLRRREAIGWFQRYFPLFFWASTLAFSLVHLFNFPADQMAMAVPLVLPQLATGTMLGYLRVHYGLWASILLHALHNGAFISLVLLASGGA